MARLSQEEADQITRKYLDLKNKSEQDPIYENEFKQYQNYCMGKFKYLVYMYTNKYRRFSNYPDLVQVGFEALVSSFNSFNLEKGAPFTWWACNYIKTRVSRAANAHSVIRFPIKKAKEMKPYKVNKMPVMIDWDSNPYREIYSAQEKDRLTKIIKELPEEHRVILNKTYGFAGENPKSAREVISELDISKTQYSKLLREAKAHIKQQFGEM